MKFVDIKNDVAFRKIFGNEKKTEILISFLNAALKLEGDHRIGKITIENPYQFPRVRGEKASIIDVRAKDLRGRQFVVEMQIASKKGFAKRIQYYTCRDYSSQIKKGDDYRLLRPTYLIGILDFNFFESKDYLSHHIILNGKTYEHKLKDIQFTFIELKKFKKKPHELKTLIEKWAFFIKNSENLDVIPENVDDEGLIEAYKDANQHTWSREELIAYDNTFIAEQDKKGELEFALEEGERQEKVSVITRCLKKNMPITVIAEIVDLSGSVVSEIIKKSKLG